MKLSEILLNPDNYKVCPYCEHISSVFTDKCPNCNTDFLYELPYYKTAKERAEELIDEIGDFDIVV